MKKQIQSWRVRQASRCNNGKRKLILLIEIVEKRFKCLTKESVGVIMGFSLRLSQDKSISIHTSV